MPLPQESWSYLNISSLSSPLAATSYLSSPTYFPSLWNIWPHNVWSMGQESHQTYPYTVHIVSGSSIKDFIQQDKRRASGGGVQFDTLCGLNLFESNFDNLLVLELQQFDYKWSLLWHFLTQPKAPVQASPHLCGANSPASKYQILAKPLFPLDPLYSFESDLSHA